MKIFEQLGQYEGKGKKENENNLCNDLKMKESTFSRVTLVFGNGMEA